MITVTKVTGEVVKLPFDELARCDNCGKTSDESKGAIWNGQLAEGEWACSSECYEEMVNKGCCFEELGDSVYRPQKY